MSAHTRGSSIELCSISREKTSHQVTCSATSSICRRLLMSAASHGGRARPRLTIDGIALRDRVWLTPAL
jgi:hypothetical protein